jgi:hypothetical protein
MRKSTCQTCDTVFEYETSAGRTRKYCCPACYYVARKGFGRKDLTGQRFGLLTVIQYAGASSTRTSLWVARCECGNEKTVRRASLIDGLTKSCGCLHAPHGETRNHATSPEWNSWSAMRARCENQSDPAWKDYGGRGVRVCERWQTFEVFLADMGRRPTSSHSIDRFPDKNGNYEPSNCRWATKKEQARNTRQNRILEYNGEALCMAEWAERLGVRPQRIHARLKRGWSVARALTEPVTIQRTD